MVAGVREASTTGSVASMVFAAPALGAMGVDGNGGKAFATGAGLLPATVPGKGGSEKSGVCASTGPHKPTVKSVTNLSSLAITLTISIC